MMFHVIRSCLNGTPHTVRVTEQMMTVPGADGGYPLGDAGGDAKLPAGTDSAEFKLILQSLRNSDQVLSDGEGLAWRYKAHCIGRPSRER